MRYHYATLHQCDSCGVTTLVPEPPDLRKVVNDPRPNGWGPPVGSQWAHYDSSDMTTRIILTDICPICMNLPMNQLLENARKRQNV